ncbi:NucA/NucB deoxyribonuclease domain-containing protein [Streptomyces olivaceus]|uniref:NucA/NucB deoxyribonuclease domain-containing protein n=1 Tax=Streptomyces olivaceus TaxID=47716 RepID=UPI0036E5E629
MSQRRERSRAIRLIPAAVIAALLTTLIGVSPADAAAPAASRSTAAQTETDESLQRQLTSRATPGSDRPTAAPEQKLARLSERETCTEPNAEGASVCVQETKPSDLPARLPQNSRATLAAVDPPQWCEDSNGGILGTRTQICQVTGLTYTTRQTVNGQTTVTGQANMIAINYSYSDTGLPTFAHQLEVSAYSGWGDALKASVDGQATMSGSCTRESASFPAQTLTPLNSWRSGEAFFDTTATAAGAIGNCTTYWYLTFTNAQYSPAVVDYQLNQFRCDNATVGRATVGCVVPWYASELVYSSASYPSLASHVERAQASGLPGATFENPLTRTEDPTIIDTNRRLACGDAPSITGLSCDEYPIARSREGLSSGGTRRTFDGCQMSHVSSGTGPTGVSVCMITATENNAQGGLNTQFFRAERVLDGDPFRVTVS